ncbi:LuxR C-terminal-related transcriptional regulator [Algibacter lectus]|uniref:PAS domain-containing protein n=1 Tax=Algibacter lectus TaxID=221126 RepID=A0A090WUX5_9FLAO|nr:LuxR C-terminal-related transcriptional regulator [Algibacter lectus]MDO7138984.1 LuxR C-terminal-related transcriptional regulator [Algibacter lectus]MWW26277.1 PAS domain-containing protein [Algibacter lectus]TDY60140.1 PAS domain-containing protein [Algibacter lectus]SFD43779.1 PAS fold-containing protein [Algibacter lectus]GAL63316.1 transcriptional regulator [Algibacter lectus]
MNRFNIKDTYKEIFKSHDNPSLKKHIEKFIELDTYLPYSSTFFCVTNTQDLTFEYISKNMTACLGLDKADLKARGMRNFWARMHPDDLEQWLQALNELMNFTLTEISLGNRERMSYTWNYRLKNAKEEYVNLIQTTTPLEFDSDSKPIIGLAHYTVLPGEMEMQVCASAKLLNCNDEYETVYFSNFSHKLLKGGISNRERDIIRLLVLNKTSKEIGVSLNISSNTVDTHRRNILKKLNISSTGELIGMLKINRSLL